MNDLEKHEAASARVVGMVALAEKVVDAFAVVGIPRDKLVFRQIACGENYQYVGMHIDTETPDFDIWVRIESENSIIVRRSAKAIYDRSRIRFTFDPEDNQRAQVYGAIAGAVNTRAMS